MTVPTIPEEFRTAFDAFEATARAHPKNIFLCVPTGTPEERKEKTQFIEYDFGTAYEKVSVLRDLFKRSGIGHGHRVGLLLGNRPEYVFCFFALNSLGAWVVPVNPENTADEMLYQVAHSDIDVGITTGLRRGEFEGIVKRHNPAVAVYDI
ncbi:MAG: AMP-binding protein, partial [Rhodospirillaceae bacterium]